MRPSGRSRKENRRIPCVTRWLHSITRSSQLVASITIKWLVKLPRLLLWLPLWSWPEGVRDRSIIERHRRRRLLLLCISHRRRNADKTIHKERANESISVVTVDTNHRLNCCHNFMRREDSRRVVIQPGDEHRNADSSTLRFKLARRQPWRSARRG